MSKVSKESERISIKFKNRLQSLLDKDDFDVVTFCKEKGISQAPIRNALTFGIVPSVLVLIKIANFFSISFDYLICEVEENNFIEAITPTPFFTRYEQLRTERNLKHSQIANVMPFARNVISEWKRNGTIPSIDNLKSLSKFFKVSIDYLLGRTDYKN